MYEQLVKDLIEARDYLIGHGWCQHASRDMDGRVCAVGALYKVTNVKERRHDGYNALSKALFRQACIHEVSVWNDDKYRRVEDVIKLYDATIDEVKSNANR